MKLKTFVFFLGLELGVMALLFLIYHQITPYLSKKDDRANSVLDNTLKKKTWKHRLTNIDKFKLFQNDKNEEPNKSSNSKMIYDNIIEQGKVNATERKFEQTCKQQQHSGSKQGYMSMKEYYTHNFRLHGIHLAKMSTINFTISTAFLHSFSIELSNILQRSDPERVMHPFFMSPAILENEDGTYALVARCRNVPRETLKKKAPTNVMVTMMYSPIFKPINTGSILGMITSESERNGPRDPRLFRIREQPFILFDMQNWREDSFHMYMLSFHTGELHRLQIYEENGTLIQMRKAERNWSPLVDDENNKLYLIYGFDPFVILQCNQLDGKCKIVQKQNENFEPQKYPSSLRGGTPFIMYKRPYYVSTAHSTVFCGGMGRRMYGIHIVVISIIPKFRIVYISANVKFHSEILKKQPIFPAAISSFIFPTTLLLRDEDMADIGGHLNDIEALLLRVKGFRTVIDEVIQIDEAVPEMERTTYEQGFIQKTNFGYSDK
ncbi:unnamed protein product [Owenia fusiformis]|uniref:Uncharacterized protein n=1 Tax=Owenia fusiformis TaxID=6347 RepID=A0A8J1U428_OWEFU|nr:unnamed protein product [Owenia fusiformis]